MKEPASSPGLLERAVCARVTNTNMLIVTSAGCRMRFSLSMVLPHVKNVELLDKAIWLNCHGCDP